MFRTSWLWTSLVWISLTQALFQTSSKLDHIGGENDINFLDANMTIGEVSPHSITVNYDIDETTIKMSVIEYQDGSNSKSSLCPPSTSQHLNRKFYSCQLDDLDMCTMYTLKYFGVPDDTSVSAAYYSEIPDVWTAADETLQPGNLTCNTSSTGVLMVQWVNPFPEGCPVVFELSWEGVASWDTDLFHANSTIISTTSYMLESVLPAAEYTIDVTVQFQTNSSGETVSTTCNTPPEPSSSPNLTVEDTGSNYIYLTWEDPVSANGIIDSYELAWTDEEGSTRKTTIDIATNDFNLTEEVYACSAYQVALAAVNGAGVGASDTKAAETAYEGINDIICEVTSDSSVMVSWTAAPANCDGNSTLLTWIGESLWDEYDNEDSILLGGGIDHFPLTDLYPYTLYTICVTLTEDWAEEICSEATTRQGVPDPPDYIETSSTQSTITLNWNETETWYGIPSNYMITCSAAHVTDYVDVNTTQFTISELEKGTQYSISVKACNEEQCSEETQTRAKTSGNGKSSNKSNTGLIVGLTLGAAVLVGAILAVLLRARRKRNSDEREEETELAESTMTSL